MLGYLAVAFRHPTGNWAAVMPDFIGVTGRGDDPSAAIQEAKAAAQAILKALKGIPASIPMPMDLGAAQRHPTLAKDYGVDWSSAVVSLVSMEADSPPQGAPIIPDAAASGSKGGIVAALRPPSRARSRGVAPKQQRSEHAAVILLHGAGD